MVLATNKLTVKSISRFVQVLLQFQHLFRHILYREKKQKNIPTKREKKEILLSNHLSKEFPPEKILPRTKLFKNLYQSVGLDLKKGNP